MIRFSKEKVKLLHQLLAEATGGSVGVRDEGVLDSALESAFAGFEGQEFYPSKEEKGAKLLFFSFMFYFFYYCIYIYIKEFLYA